MKKMRFEAASDCSSQSDQMGAKTDEVMMFFSHKVQIIKLNSSNIYISECSDMIKSAQDGVSTLILFISKDG